MVHYRVFYTHKGVFMSGLFNRVFDTEVEAIRYCLDKRREYGKDKTKFEILEVTEVNITHKMDNL